MTNPEFLDEFDLLYNNISSNKAPGLDAYEKSVFLTMAQEEYVKGVYSGRLLGSFEANEEARRQLDTLVKPQVSCSSTTGNPIKDQHKHTVFNLPGDCWYIIYEQASVKTDNCLNDTSLMIQPTTHDVYHKVKNNPFKGPNDRRILRLDTGKLEVELISKYDINSYDISYLVRPNPIILESLINTDNSINGEQDEMPCELSELIHRDILNIAVKLAIDTYNK